MNKKRILVIENSVAVTGALNSILRSSTYLCDQLDFVFILPSGSLAVANVKEAGFACIELPMKEIRRDFFSLASYIPTLIANTRKVSRIVLDQKIDLIVSNDFYNLIPAVYKMFGGARPYVCYVRFLPAKFPTPLVKLWFGMNFRYAASIIAVSEAVKKQLPHSGNVVVIGNELPAASVAYNPTSSTVLLYPGNYIPGKGQVAALESFALIAKKFGGWTLRFVGGDMGLVKNREYRVSLEHKARQLGISDQVEWMNFSSNMQRLYQDAAIVLNFSESESFSMTCLEGLYYGRPVIATDSGGPSEIIDHNESGLLVAVGDIGSMGRALEELMTNADRRDAMGLTGFNRVRERFSNAVIVSKLREIYEAALRN